MAAFSPLLDVLADVPGPRRAQGRLHKLPHVLLFAILAIVTGCSSYRGVERRQRNPGVPSQGRVAAQAGIALTVGVEDNQPTLRQQVQEVSATTAPLGAARSHDQGRNRGKRPTVTVFDAANSLAGTA